MLPRIVLSVPIFYGQTMANYPYNMVHMIWSIWYGAHIMDHILWSKISALKLIKKLWIKSWYNLLRISYRVSQKRFWYSISKLFLVEMFQHFVAFSGSLSSLVDGFIQGIDHQTTLYINDHPVRGSVHGYVWVRPVIIVYSKVIVVNYQQYLRYPYENKPVSRSEDDSGFGRL